MVHVAAKHTSHPRATGAHRVGLPLLRGSSGLATVLSTVLGLGASVSLAATEPSQPVVASVGQDMVVTLAHAGGAAGSGLRSGAVLKVEVTSEAVQNLVGGASLRVEVDADCSGRRIRTRRFEVFHGARQTGAQTVRPTTGAWTLATPGSYVPDILAAVCSQPAVEIAAAPDTPTEAELAALTLKSTPAPQFLALPSAAVASQEVAGGDSLTDTLGLAAAAEPLIEAPTQYALLKSSSPALLVPPVEGLAAKAPDLGSVQTFEMAVEPAASPAEETGPTEYLLRASNPVRLDAPPLADLQPISVDGTAVQPVAANFDFALSAATPEAPSSQKTDDAKPTDDVPNPESRVIDGAAATGAPSPELTPTFQLIAQPSIGQVAQPTETLANGGAPSSPPSMDLTSALPQPQLLETADLASAAKTMVADTVSDHDMEIAMTSPPSPTAVQPLAPNATLASPQPSPPLTTLAPQAVSVKVETGEAAPFGDASPPSLEDQASPRMTAVLTPISMTSPPAGSANASLNRIVSASEALQSGGAGPESFGRYWVQILSTNNAAGARASLEKAVASLKSSLPGGSGEILPHRIGSETWYRVRLQGFASRTEASDFCASYLGNAKACVISER